MGENVNLNKYCYRGRFRPIEVLEGINETFFVSMQAGDIKMRYKNKHLNCNVSSKANDACLTDSGDTFFTTFTNKSINFFSLDTSGNASLLFSAASSIHVPYGICHATLNKNLHYLLRWWKWIGNISTNLTMTSPMCTSTSRTVRQCCFQSQTER